MDDFNLLVDYAPAWNALLIESASHVPFLRFEYLHAWWQTRGGGEWPQAKPAVVLGLQDGKLAGIAPLFLDRNKQGQTALLLLGSIEISDYLDVISRSGDLPDFLQGLLDFLVSPDFPDWQVLDLYNILDHSPTLPALEQAAREKGWEYSVERLQHSPFIALPGDWETYLGQIDKKQRHEIRRKMRRAEEADLPIRWYVVEDGATLEAETESFLGLMAQDDEKAAFLTPAMRHQMHTTTRCAFDNGCLQLAFLEIDGKKAAGYLNFNYLNRIWVYNSGIDRQFMEYSPGWVLLGNLLKWANENKISEFDFMRGDEEYKYRFGGQDRFVMHAVILRGS